ncbi:cytochrome P450 67, partial [Puccinia sorghi]
MAGKLFLPHRCSPCHHPSTNIKNFNMAVRNRRGRAELLELNEGIHSDNILSSPRDTPDYTLADPNSELVMFLSLMNHLPHDKRSHTSFSDVMSLQPSSIYPSKLLSFYRLFWHDLRSFPGPKMATLTQGWILREAYFGRTRFTMKELGEKYGEWVRIGERLSNGLNGASLIQLVGPNELYTTSIEALYTIMGAKGWPKGPSYDSGITKGDSGGDSVLTIKTLPEHAIRRRIWTKAFTPKAIAEYLPSIDARLDEMLNIIDDHVKQNKSVDLCLQIGCFVYNTMCDMAYGALTGTDLSKNQEEKHRILTHMGRVVRQVGTIRN